MFFLLIVKSFNEITLNVISCKFSDPILMGLDLKPSVIEIIQKEFCHQKQLKIALKFSRRIFL